MARMLVETFLVFFCVHAIEWTHSMTIRGHISFQKGDLVLIKLPWDGTTSALAELHLVSSNNTCTKIAGCKKNSTYENVCNISNPALSEDYVVWGKLYRTYLVIKEMSDETAGMYLFDDEHNPMINLIIEVKPNFTTRWMPQNNEMYQLQAIGLTHMDKKRWVQKGGLYLSKVRWIDTTTALDVYFVQSNSTPILIATCRENTNFTNVCVTTNHEHSKDYAIWGELKNTFLVIEEISDKTAGTYLFVDKHNESIRLSIDVPTNFNERWLTEHNQIYKQLADGDDGCEDAKIHCATQGAVCSSSNTCVCPDGQFSKNGQCIPKLADGDDGCEDAKIHCATQGAVCSSSYTCVCPDGQFSKNGQCIPKLADGDGNCTDAKIQCATQGAVCSSYTCACQEGKVSKNGQCHDNDKSEEYQNYATIGVTYLFVILVFIHLVYGLFYTSNRHDNNTRVKRCKRIAICEGIIIILSVILLGIITGVHYSSNNHGTNSFTSTFIFTSGAAGILIGMVSLLMLLIRFTKIQLTCCLEQLVSDVTIPTQQILLAPMQITNTNESHEKEIIDLKKKLQEQKDEVRRLNNLIDTYDKDWITNQKKITTLEKDNHDLKIKAERQCVELKQLTQQLESLKQENHDLKMKAENDSVELKQLAQQHESSAGENQSSRKIEEPICAATNNDSDDDATNE